MNSASSGKGVYMSGGRSVEISWITSASGELEFYNESGERLCVNRGTSYIALVKSSMKSSVKIA